MANYLVVNQPQVFVGLGTLTYNIPSPAPTSLYTVRLQSTEVPPSGLVITVKNGASTKYTSPTLTPTQGAVQFSFKLPPVSAADAITVVLSSASAIDAAYNNVKSSISIEQGY